MNELKYTFFTGSANEWNKIITNLNQKSYKNTYEYGTLRAQSNWAVKRVLIFRDNTLISAFQFITKKKFFFKIYLLMGGIEGAVDNEILIFIKTKVINLDFVSLVCIDLINSFEFLKLNFKYIIVDSKDFLNNYMIKKLPKSIDILADTYTQNWRHNYKRSKKYNLKTNINMNPDIDEIMGIYKSMADLKKIKIPYKKNYIIHLFNFLKINLVHFETRNNGELISFRTIFINNSYAFDLLAANSLSARNKYSSYEIIDFVFKFLITNNIQIFDFSGVDPSNNLGVYNFKKGTGSQLHRKFGEIIIGRNICLNYFFLLLLKVRRFLII